jgi:hypothetical protein
MPDQYANWILDALIACHRRSFAENQFRNFAVSHVRSNFSAFATDSQGRIIIGLEYSLLRAVNIS